LREGICSYLGRSLDVVNIQEKSAEVIVATRNEPNKNYGGLTEVVKD
jgi:hypothetical protein